MDFPTFLTQLNILLNDEDNFTFTTDQKTQAATTAWQDNYVATPVWDSSLTYATGTYQYTLPSTVSALADVYILRDTCEYPEPIDNSMWEIDSLAGVPTLTFLQPSRYILCDTYQLFLKGRYQITTNDTLPTVNLQNYVLALAGYLTLRQISYMRVLRFLNNDTTLADILNLRKDLQQDMLNYRQAVQRDFESN